mmetsp:Transcript_17074/g.37631  ORF Transcript_17074/g.37631 Transcript_17074/m.37631 type:complete len:279 (-) Transcript_17074:348-1184(-)
MHLDSVRQHGRQQGVEVLHPISSGNERQVDSIVAAGPLLGDPQGLLHSRGVQVIRNGVEVVAQVAVLARNAHVVRVQPSQLVRDLRCVVANGVSRHAGAGVAAVVARVNAVHARPNSRLHGSVFDSAVDHTVTEGATLGLSAVVGHVRVPLVLLLRVGQAVSDGDTLQRDLEVTLRGGLPQLVRDCGNVVPGIALPEQVELVVLVLWVLLVESLHELVHVGRDASLIVNAESGREPSARRLVNPDHVGVGVPRAWVRGGSAILVYLARAVLREERQLG